MTLHYTYVFLPGYGWFEGKILYFNTQVRVYHILLTEGTTDYVAAEDFDGIGFILLLSFFWACAFCSFIAYLCVKFQLIWSVSHPWSFFGSLHPACSFFLNCSYFLGNLSHSALIKCLLIKKVLGFYAQAKISVFYQLALLSHNFVIMSY